MSKERNSGFEERNTSYYIDAWDRGYRGGELIRYLKERREKDMKAFHKATPDYRRREPLEKLAYKVYPRK